MEDLAAAALLGLVQGLTEFLPVSSTAHLALSQRVLGLDPERFGLSFDVALHLGTALAILVYFARTWLELLVDVLAGRWRLALLLLVGTIPAVIVGTLIEGAVEDTLRSPGVIAATLVLGSIVFVAAEAVGRQRFTIPDVRARDALLIGLAQASALLPGVSRSGITISGGLLVGLRRTDAARFSFLLATPVILGAGAKRLLDLEGTSVLLARPDVAATGFAVAFVSGFAAIAFLMRFLRTRSLVWFVPYRLALAGVILVAMVAGVL